MKKPIPSSIIIAAALIISVSTSILLSRPAAVKKMHSAGAQLTDQLGNPVTISAPNPRIISGYTAFTEILRELGAESLIVGATQNDARELQVQSIGSHMRPDIEAMLATNPQLILLSSGRPNVVETLQARTAGTSIQIYAAHPSTVEQTLQLIHSIGEMVHCEAEAERQILASRHKLKQVATALHKQHQPKRTVFVEIRNSPSLLSCGSDSIVSDILRLAGAESICTLPGSVAQFNMEALVDAQPDFYLQQLGVMNKAPIPLNEHPVLCRLDCIQKGQFKSIKEAILSRPGPQVADTVEQIYQWLYTEGN